MRSLYWTQLLRVLGKVAESVLKETIELHTSVRKVQTFLRRPQNVDIDKRSRRLANRRTEKNIAFVRAAVRRNRRITISELSDDVQISYGPVQAIVIDDLGMRVVSTEFVPNCFQLIKTAFVFQLHNITLIVSRKMNIS